MDYVIKYSKQNNYKTISLEVPDTSVDARHIYEKHGFVVDNKDDDWAGLTSMKLKNK